MEAAGLTGLLAAPHDLRSAALEHLHDGVVIYDPHGVVVAANHRAAELLGLSDDELAGRPVGDRRWDAVDADGAPWPPDRFPVQLARVTGEPQLDRLMGVRVPGGDTRWILINANPVHAGAELLGVVASFVEVTAMREAQLALAEREQQFRLLAEQATDVVGRADRDAVWTYVSPACRRVLGYAPEELVGRSAFELMHPDDVAEAQAARRALLAGADQLTFEHRHPRPEGGWRWVQHHVGVVRGPGGAIEGFLTHLRDVDERHRGEEALRRAGALFTSAFERAPTGMALEDPDGCLLRVNRALCELLALDEDALLGRRLADFAPGEVPDALAPLRSSVSDETEAEHPITTADGRRVLVRRAISAVRDEDGALLHCVTHVEDVTDQRDAEARVRRLAARGPLGLPDAPLDHGTFRRALATLEATADLGAALVQPGALPDVLRLVVERGRELVSARGVVLALLQDDDLEIAATAGEAPLRVGARVPLAESNFGDVLRTGRPVQRRDVVAVSPTVAGDEPVRLASLLVVPMLSAGRAVGLLAAGDKLGGDGFGDDDIRTLQTFAATAAAAVELARDVADDRLREVLAAQEAERGRWARELHDDTLQHLAALSIQLTAAAQAAGGTAIAATLHAAVAQVRVQIAALRGLITDLRPADLDELGLPEAIGALAERTEAAWGLQVRTRIDAGPHRLAADVEATAYRVLQEALTNAGKHAAATTASVEVVADDDVLRLRVSDDGHGFDPADRADGFGLRGMRERVALLGGTLRVAPAQRGTVVEARLPI